MKNIPTNKTKSNETPSETPKTDVAAMQDVINETEIHSIENFLKESLDIEETPQEKTLTAQEQTDMTMTPGKTGWIPYWIERLNKEAKLGELPKEIRHIITRFTDKTGRVGPLYDLIKIEVAELKKYVEDRITKYRTTKAVTTILVTPKTPARTAGTPILTSDIMQRLGEELKLGALPEEIRLIVMRLTDKTGHVDLPRHSKLDKREATKLKAYVREKFLNEKKATDEDEVQEKSKTATLNAVDEKAQEEKDLAMTTDKGGWDKYWITRLESELDMLPEEIAAIVKKKKINKNLEYYELRAYVEKRTGKNPVDQLLIDKAMAMQQFHETLAAIDNHEDFSLEEQQQRHTISYDEATKNLLVKHGETLKPITIGDIIGDNVWGLRYRPDMHMPEKLWRRIRKTIAIAETRELVHRLSDRILLIKEHLSSTITMNMPIALIETSLQEGRQLDSTQVAGALAEYMVQSCMQRIAIDDPSLGITVKPSNIIEDSIFKYDLKISYTPRTNGHTVVGEHTLRHPIIYHRIGIQITTEGRDWKIKEKIKSIDEAKKYMGLSKEQSRVDDIILVQLPFFNFEKAFWLWLKHGKPPGGPEQYLPAEEKLQIFQGCTMNGAILKK